MTDPINTPEPAENMIDPKAVGVETSWSFGYGDAEAVCIDRQSVRDVFEANGVTPKIAASLVPTLDSNAAIKRALRYAPKKKHLAIKELARPNNNAVRVVGIYVRDARQGEAGDGWRMAARVRFDGHAHAIVCLPPEGAATFGSAEAKSIGEAMAAMANNVMANVMNVDISDALCDLGHARGWITRRRNSGGVYFLPTHTERAKGTAEAFVKILFGLAALTDHLPRRRQFIPQCHDLFPSPMTMSSWSGSAQDNFEADITKLQGELDRMAADGKMRDTTKAERAAQADAIIAKAENYRVFLGAAVDTIGTRLDTIKAAFKAPPRPPSTVPVSNPPRRPRHPRPRPRPSPPGARRSP